MTERDSSKTAEIIASIAAAYAARSNVSADDIVALVSRLRVEFLSDLQPSPEQLSAIQLVAGSPTVDVVKATPALAIDEAVTRDTVYCLCCGKGFKMLKRHLRSEHDLSEEAYRQRFDLPDDMPLVAPSYSERKAAYAMRMGFGKYERASGESDKAEATPKISTI